MKTMTAVWNRIRILSLAAAALLAWSGTALAQQFEKVENIPRQEIPAGRFVSIAYGIIWLAILTYVVIVAAGVRRVNQEIADLRRKVDRAGPKG
jgi:TRAP-type C4-dicarboxylate transport system permease small subunit